jgi:hypothetical protein
MRQGMRRVALGCAVFGLVTAATAGTDQAAAGDKDAARHGIVSVNPAGFLFFGPSADVDVLVKPDTNVKVSLTVGARNTAAGFLAQELVREHGGRIERGAMVGIGPRFYLSRKADALEGLHLGPRFEFGTMRTGLGNEFFQEALLFDVGRTFISGVFAVSVGGQIGVAQTRLMKGTTSSARQEDMELLGAIYTSLGVVF